MGLRVQFRSASFYSIRTSFDIRDSNFQLPRRKPSRLYDLARLRASKNRLAAALRAVMHPHHRLLAQVHSIPAENALAPGVKIGEQQDGDEDDDFQQ